MQQKIAIWVIIRTIRGSYFCHYYQFVFRLQTSIAYMAQHTWRSLDSAIVETINDETLDAQEKDKRLANCVIELEAYIETYER